jgi:copper oxidase (laccase) domain-containing protein
VAEKMILNDNVLYFCSQQFLNTELVEMGFSTRQGGVSTEEFTSMNLGYNRGDAYERVAENHKIFGKTLGYNHKNTCNRKTKTYNKY